MKKLSAGGAPSPCLACLRESHLADCFFKPGLALGLVDTIFQVEFERSALMHLAAESLTHMQVASPKRHNSTNSER